VADLLARTTPAEQAVVSAIQERAAAEATARAEWQARDRTSTTAQFPPVVEAATGDEPRTSHRLARTIMVATTAMLMCGVVTAFSVLTTDRAPRLSPSVPTVGPTTISGAAVVRPDLLNQQLAAGLLTIGRRPARGGSTGSVGGLRPDDDVSAQRFSGVVLPERVPAAATGQQADRVRRLVVDFYEKAEESPEQAFTLLGPEMRGDGLASFVRGWNDLLVEVQQLVIGPGGVARAVIVIAWPDATVIRAEQLLIVSDGPDPKIARAELLSAHRG
jgi:hypothetical protein